MKLSILTVFLSFAFIFSYDVAAQGFSPFGGGGGECGSQCPKDCEDKKKQCQKDIERLKNLCRRTGMVGFCREAKKKGCDKSEEFCKEMCQVEFRSSCGKPKPGGRSLGDPHIITHDGLLYQFQAAGEFILYESEDKRLQVQSRQQAAVKRKDVSYNSAVAFKFDDLNIAFDIRDDNMILRINGEAQTVETLELQKGTVRIQNDWTNLYINHAEFGDFRVRKFAKSLTIDVAPYSESFSGNGLLGNNNGDITDDLYVNNDSKSKGVEITREYLYGPFRARWALNDDTSVLPYRDGESNATFDDLNFPYNEPKVTVEDMEKAREICRDRNVTHPDAIEICAFDVAVTGDESFAEAYPDFEGEFVVADIRSKYSRLSEWDPITFTGDASNDWVFKNDGYHAEVQKNTEMPTVLLSDFNSAPFEASLNLNVNTHNDDDMVGIVLYDSANHFYIFDWRQVAQNYKGMAADEGWRFYEIQGDLSPDFVKENALDLFWGQIPSEALTVLSPSSGVDTGWRDKTSYNLRLTYSAEEINLYVDGNLVIQHFGDFPDNLRFGLYNYSQPYSEFSNVELNSVDP